MKIKIYPTWLVKVIAIYGIVFNRSVGIVVFKRKPSEGDTITVQNMVATFKKEIDKVL